MKITGISVNVEKVYNLRKNKNFNVINITKLTHETSCQLALMFSSSFRLFSGSYCIV